MISTITHNITLSQITDFVYKLEDDLVFEGLVNGRYSIVFTYSDGLLIKGYDELPDTVERAIQDDRFQVDRPLWYWCSVDPIRERVKDLFYHNWLVSMENRTKFNGEMQ